MSPLSPPLPGKEVKLFFSISLKTLVSKIQFGTSTQSPSFQHQGHLWTLTRLNHRYACDDPEKVKLNWIQLFLQERFISYFGRYFTNKREKIQAATKVETSHDSGMFPCLGQSSAWGHHPNEVSRCYHHGRPTLPQGQGCCSSLGFGTEALHPGALCPGAAQAWPRGKAVSAQPGPQHSVW